MTVTSQEFAGQGPAGAAGDEPVLDFKITLARSKREKDHIEVFLGGELLHADSVRLGVDKDRTRLAQSLIKLLDGRGHAMDPGALKTTLLQAYSAAQASLEGSASEGPVLETLGLEVLAEAEDRSILVFSTSTQKFTWISRIATLTWTDVIQLMGPPAGWEGGSSVPGFSIERVRNALAVAASQARRGGPLQRCGKGVWEPSAGDPRTLVIDGDTALLFGERGPERLDRPIVGDRLIDYGDRRAWHGSILQELERADFQGAQQAFRELRGIVGRWSWGHPRDADCVAALVVATVLQRLWVWRPIVGVTGGSGSGKTLLVERVLRPVFGLGATITELASEAGLRQQLGNTARPFVVDEFDSNPQRQKILELLRTSGRGGEVLRGTRDHTPRRFEVRHVPWILGIELGDIRQQDTNRLLTFELDRFGKQIEIPSSRDLESLGKRLAVGALLTAEPMVRLADQLRGIGLEGVEPRVVESAAVPAAVLATFRHGREVSLEQGASELREIMRGRQFVPQQEERSLLDAILAARIPVNNYRGQRSASVAQLLSSSSHRAELETVGLKVMDREPRRLFIDTQVVRKELLQETRFQDMTIDKLLLRLPGAKRSQQRLAGRKPHGIGVPWEVCFEEGCEAEQIGRLPGRQPRGAAALSG